MKPVTHTLELPDLIAYAGATWDWHKLHYDPDFVAASGLPGPVVDGQVFGAFVADQLTREFGDDCFIQRLSFEFKNMMFAGETVEITGSIEDQSGGVATTSHVLKVGDKVVCLAQATTKIEVP